MAVSILLNSELEDEEVVRLAWDKFIKNANSYIVACSHLETVKVTDCFRYAFTFFPNW